MPQVIDGYGRDKASGQTADSIARLVDATTARQRETRVLAWVAVAFSGVAAVASVVAAVNAH